MIPASQAKKGTKVEDYIKEKCKDIEQSIMLSMELGLSYTKYTGNLPASIRNMLEELGYTIIETSMFGTTIYVIAWSNAEDIIKCN